MKATEIKVVWHDVEIVYEPRTNKWVCEVRGRERQLDSLELAKQCIDKPEPKETAPFERFKAWYMDYRENPVLVEVTSIAIPPKWQTSRDVWVNYPFGTKAERRKVDSRHIYPCNAHNDALVKELQELAQKSAEIENAENACASKMKRFVLPEDGK